MRSPASPKNRGAAGASPVPPPVAASLIGGASQVDADTVVNAPPAVNADAGGAAATKTSPSSSSASSPGDKGGSSHPPTPSRTTEALGLVAMAIAALLFSVMSALVKYGGRAFSTWELIFSRSIVQSVLCLGMAKALGVDMLGPRAMRWKLFSRGLVGSVALSGYYYAIVHMDLGEATTLFFTSPVFTAILAQIWLGEPMALVDGVSALACLIGVMLVSRPSFLFGASASSPSALSAADAAARPWAIGAALTGAALSAVAFVLVRQMGKSTHYLTQVAWFGCVTAVYSGVIMAADTSNAPRWPADAREWGVLMGIGVSAFAGQVFMTQGLAMARAGPAVLMRNLDVVFAFIFGILFFGERPGWMSILGAVLIIGTTAVVGLYKLLARRPEEKSPPKEGEA